MNNLEIYNEHLINEAPKELARRYHLEFIDYCWIKKIPFIIGDHTKAICDIIDNAFDRYDKGESVFYIITVCFRHGKTDMVSRYLPPHYLGRYPDNEVLVATHTSNFSKGISRIARRIVDSGKYNELYPNIKLSKEIANVDEWGIDSHLGMSRWCGVGGGGATGNGYDLGIVDDYFKNRQDAESETIRNTQWEWFTDVFLTRRAPVSITFLVVTPWHVDDIVGRIKKEMKNNPDFPRFEFISFPAFSEDYKDDILFPERFDKQWYASHKATLGTYGTSSLMQCNPITRGGNLLKTDNIKIINQSDVPDFANFTWFNGWDLASSEKELVKSDPDYTARCLLSLRYNDKKAPVLYIRHVFRVQAEAPERNRKIQEYAKIDGPTVKIGIECVAGYKDTYTIMKDILMGISSVQEITVSRDKIARASVLEPIFEAGNVYLFRGDWNLEFIEECSQFPSGKHDDQIDAMVCAYEMARKRAGTFKDIPSSPMDIPITAGLRSMEF